MGTEKRRSMRSHLTKAVNQAVNQASKAGPRKNKRTMSRSLSLSADHWDASRSSGLPAVQNVLSERIWIDRGCMALGALGVASLLVDGTVSPIGLSDAPVPSTVCYYS